MNSTPTARAILALACASLVWLSRAALDTRSLLLSWDLQGHILRSQHMVGRLSPSDGFTGWFPYWHGGFPLSDVYPPLTSWLLGVFVGFGIEAAAARLLMVSLWVLVVPASYLFLRNFGFNRVPAALGSALTMALDSPWTFGSYAIFRVGLLPNALGFLLALAALTSAKRHLNGARPGTAARMAFFGGLAVLAHPLTALWLAAAWVVLFATAWPVPGRRAGLFGLGALGALAIGSYYWLPLVSQWNTLLATEPFAPRSATQLWLSTAALERMGGKGAAILAVIGLGFLACLRHRRSVFFFGGLLLVSFLAAVGAPSALLPGGALGQTQWGRFEGFYGWTALMAAAFVLQGSAQLRPGLRRRAAFGLASVAVGLVAIGGLGRQRGQVMALPAAPLEDLRGLAGALEPKLTAGDFLLTENALKAAGEVGSPHFLNQRLPRANPYFWDQGGSFPEGTAGADGFFTLSRQLPGFIAQSRVLLAAGGVRFVATVGTDGRDALDRIPWLSRVWAGSAGSGMALYEVTDFNRRFGLDPSISAGVVDVKLTKPSTYRVFFSTRQTLGYPLSTALSFHPWLQAAIDGQPTRTAAGPFGRLVVTGGPDSGEQLTIAFVRPPWIRPLRTFALAALATSFVLSVLRRKKWRTVMDNP